MAMEKSSERWENPEKVSHTAGRYEGKGIREKKKREGIRFFGVQVRRVRGAAVRGGGALSQMNDAPGRTRQERGRRNLNKIQRNKKGERERKTGGGLT